MLYAVSHPLTCTNAILHFLHKFMMIGFTCMHFGCLLMLFCSYCCCLSLCLLNFKWIFMRRYNGIEHNHTPHIEKEWKRTWPKKKRDINKISRVYYMNPAPITARKSSASTRKTRIKPYDDDDYAGAPLKRINSLWWKLHFECIIETNSLLFLVKSHNLTWMESMWEKQVYYSLHLCSFPSSSSCFHSTLDAFQLACNNSSYVREGKKIWNIKSNNWVWVGDFTRILSLSLPLS